MTKKKLDFYVEKIKEFNHLRGWHQLPQNNAKSIVIEAAELLEHFQWDGEINNSSKYQLQDKNITEIKKEAADVFWYLVAFCRESGFELVDAVELKYKHNMVKYPLKMFEKENSVELYYQRKNEYRKNKK